MALKNLFDMVKADRYTADGREAIIKAQKAETEDATRRTYQIGEISQTTGLQKTANGWKPPKETKFGKVKQNKEGQWGVQTKQGKGSDFLKHKSEKEASRALANYTAGYNTTERSKQDPHSDKARQIKQWNKETEKIRKNNNAERRAEHAAQFAKKIQPGSVIQNAREQSESFEKQRADYLEAYRNETNEDRKDILSSLAFNSEKQRSLYEGIADYNDSVGGWKINNGVANKLHDLQEEQMRLEAKLDKMKNEPGPDRDDSPERAAYERELSRQQAQRAADDPRGFGYEEPPMEPAAESKPDAADQRDEIGGEIKGNLEAAKYYFDKAQSFYPTDPSYKTYMTKAKQYNDEAKAQADDNGFDFEEMHNSGITQAVNKYAEEQSKTEGRNFRSELEANPKGAYDFEKTIEHSIPMTAGDKEILGRVKSFMQEEGTDYKNALKSVATGLVNGNKLHGDWYPEKEKSLLKIAKAVGMDEEVKSYVKTLAKGYDFGYSEDAAPRIRQLTGDCRIRIRKEKPALTGDTKIRVRK